MANFEQRENSGVLFPNDRKTGNQPDYRGEANVNGEAVEVSGWRKQGKKGEFISLSFKEKWTPNGSRDNGPDDDSDIPL